MSQNEVKICFCGSGSGGHLKPLVSLYLKLGKLKESSFFLCSPHSFDRSFTKEWDVPVEFMAYTRISQGSFLFVLWKILYCLIEVIFLFLRKKPDLIIGTGGYGSFPVYLACILLSIDFYIIEPNSICGKVNRWFQSFSKKIFTSFISVKGLKSSDKIVKSGVPVVYTEPSCEEEAMVLIFGASLGAKGINSFMQKYFEAYGADQSYRYVWITGVDDFDQYKYFSQHSNIEVLSFVKEMQGYLQKAALIISRSGAGCIADVEYFKVPSIFIPYPYHADRQQFLNASDLEKSGACIIWEESSLADMEINRVAELKALLNPKCISSMKSKFSPKKAKNAAEVILEIVLKGKLLSAR